MIPEFRDSMGPPLSPPVGMVRGTRHRRN